MTDHAPSDDELISAYLDGEATPDEVARIEADPALSARADALRAASELVATPVAPLATADAERLIEAALAAGSASDDVIDLRAETMRRQRLRQRLVTVAAGVLLLGLAVPLLFAINAATDGGSDTVADAPTEPDDGADEAAEEMALDAATSDMAFADDADDAGGEGEAQMAEPAEEGAAEFDAEPLDEAPDDSGDTTARTLPDRAFILPGGLGPYDDTADLVEEFTEIWRARTDDDNADPLPELTTTTLFNALPCGFAFVDFFAGRDALVDLTVVTIDGAEFVAALVDLGEGRGLIGLADPPDCEVDELAELSD